jgi:hypothetical protein
MPGCPKRRGTHLFLALALLASPARSLAQGNSQPDDLPEAPSPQHVLASLDPPQPQPPSAQAPAAQAPDPTSPEKSEHDVAEEQVRQEETQRVVGILPAFYMSYNSDAVSISPMQKLDLAVRSSFDPFTIGVSFVVSGWEEAVDSDPGFRWGPEGYGRRTGAAYLDAVNSIMIGNAFLPILLHQDPRYFRLGHGPKSRRMLHALAFAVICKHDNGRWEPNYSNVLGNIASGALSNLYYPAGNSGAGQTISTGLVVTAEGTVGSVLLEFWPDLSRRFLHQDPTNGADFQAEAADRTAKQAVH